MAVSLHHPQAFLIKFQHRRHCEEALVKGYVKRRGIEIHFIKWHSLQSALGVALMFRVRLCLDGVPMHAWAADITERIIGRTCTLEQIETDVVHPVESGNTRSIDLWAWTANPSTIPKRMWLSFTNRAKDPKLAPLLAVESPPEHWQRGVRHPVLFHLEEIHDYTAATIDLEEQGSFGRSVGCRMNTGVLGGRVQAGVRFSASPRRPLRFPDRASGGRSIATRRSPRSPTTAGRSRHRDNRASPGSAGAMPSRQRAVMTLMRRARS